LQKLLAQEFDENDFEKACFAAKVFSKTAFKNPLQKENFAGIATQKWIDPGISTGSDHWPNLPSG
jgi:hypothetical protein